MYKSLQVNLLVSLFTIKGNVWSQVSVLVRLVHHFVCCFCILPYLSKWPQPDFVGSSYHHTIPYFMFDKNNIQHLTKSLLLLGQWSVLQRMSFWEVIKISASILKHFECYYVEHTSIPLCVCKQAASIPRSKWTLAGCVCIQWRHLMKLLEN